MNKISECVLILECNHFSHSALLTVMMALIWLTSCNTTSAMLSYAMLLCCASPTPTAPFITFQQPRISLSLTQKQKISKHKHVPTQIPLHCLPLSHPSSAPRPSSNLQRPIVCGPQFVETQ